MIISKFIQTNNCFILFGAMNLDSYHVLSKGLNQVKKNKYKQKKNSPNLNSNRHQTTWDQSIIYYFFINMSTTTKLAFIIHCKQREFLYLSTMKEKEIDEEMIIIKICKKIKGSYISNLSLSFFFLNWVSFSWSSRLQLFFSRCLLSLQDQLVAALSPSLNGIDLQEKPFQCSQWCLLLFRLILHFDDVYFSLG